MNISSLILAIFFWSAVATVAAGYSLASGNPLHLSAEWIGIVAWMAPIIAILAPLFVLPLLGAMSFAADYCKEASIYACFTLIPAFAWSGYLVFDAKSSWLCMLYWGEGSVLTLLVVYVFLHFRKRPDQK